MAKTKISEFSATPGNNTDIDGINIAEGCAPSGINDAIRELMSQLKDFQAGTAGDSFNGPVGTTTAAAGAFTTLSSTGNTTLGDASGDSVTINGNANFANVNPTLTAGTANGVAYLNGSKVLTTGSALTFDGTNFQVGGNSQPIIRAVSSLTNNATARLFTDGDTVYVGSLNSSTAGANVPVVFQISGTERARITSGGYFKASNAGTYLSSTGDYHELRSSNDNYLLYAINTRNGGGGPFGISVEYSAQDPNGTGNEFLQCVGISTLRAEIRSNGGLANYSANDVNLSDRREKTNFAPAKSYLDTICAIPVQTFNYIDQSEDDPGLTLGVVAQDVQAVAPELVMESNWGTEDNPKMRLSIYQTDLQYALMKALQELKAEFDAYKATHP